MGRMRCCAHASEVTRSSEGMMARAVRWVLDSIQPRRVNLSRTTLDTSLVAFVRHATLGRGHVSDSSTCAADLYDSFHQCRVLNRLPDHPTARSTATRNNALPRDLRCDLCHRIPAWSFSNLLRSTTDRKYNRTATLQDTGVQ